MGHGLVDGGGRGANVSCSEPAPLDPSFKFSVAMSKNKGGNYKGGNILFVRINKKHAGNVEMCCTLAEISKCVVTLFREGDLVDGVSQIAVFEQAAGIFPSITPVFESFNP